MPMMPIENMFMLVKRCIHSFSAELIVKTSCNLELLPFISTSTISTNILINFSNITITTTGISTSINETILCTFVPPLATTTSSINFLACARTTNITTIVGNIINSMHQKFMELILQIQIRC